MFNQTAIAILDKSDFSSRFLDFVERYEKFRNVIHDSISNSWVEQHDYEYIMHYLKPSPLDEITPFTLTDFACMSESEIVFWHDYCIELKYLLDEKKSLYETLNKYYQI